MSAVYESTNTGTLMVAFSVPIWSDPVEVSNRQRIGILGMCVELGEFAIGRRALLADTRVDQLEGKRGLVLHHEKLTKGGRESVLPRLDPAILSQAFELSGDRNRSDRLYGEAKSNIIEEFLDPVDEKPHLVAIEPVIIAGRPTEIADTGWIVVAEESAD